LEIFGFNVWKRKTWHHITCSTASSNDPTLQQPLRSAPWKALDSIKSPLNLPPISRVAFEFWQICVLTTSVLFYPKFYHRKLASEFAQTQSLFVPLAPHKVFMMCSFIPTSSKHRILHFVSSMFILIWIKQGNLTTCLFLLATKKGLYFCVFILEQNMGSMLVFLRVQLINCPWYFKIESS
jgi:hypothetical protein